ncbi:MAG: calcium/sodium antiporter [Phycisphaerae bacterium]
MAWLTVVLFLLGFVLLIGGAEVLVRGASRMAGVLGVPPLIVGLTVVSFGTSSPELAVSAGAALKANGEVALGNAIGSNVCNVLLILGASALVAPLIVQNKLIRRDVPVMLGVAVVPLLIGLDGVIGMTDGVLLLAGLAAYLLFLFFAARSGDEAALGVAELSHASGRPGAPAEGAGGREQGQGQGQGRGRVLAVSAGFVVAGLVLLVIGSDWLVDGAVSIATAFGVSQTVISLTVVAFGTSLPELAACVSAAWKGERDIAVGNVVGSNIFNVLGILGVAGVLSAKGGVIVSSSMLYFDIPVMIAVCLACIPVFVTGGQIARWEGGLFVAYYAAYVLYLVLDAVGHAALGPYSNVLFYFVVPLTGVTLSVLLAGTIRRKVKVGRRRRRRLAAAESSPGGDAAGESGG